MPPQAAVWARRCFELGRLAVAKWGPTGLTSHAVDLVGIDPRRLRTSCLPSDRTSVFAWFPVYLDSCLARYSCCLCKPLRLLFTLIGQLPMYMDTEDSKQMLEEV